MRRPGFVGTRYLDPPEAAAAERAGISMLTPADACGAPLERALDALAAKARRVYVHIGLDVLEPKRTCRRDEPVPNLFSPQRSRRPRR